MDYQISKKEAFARSFVQRYNHKKYWENWCGMYRDTGYSRPCHCYHGSTENHH